MKNRETKNCYRRIRESFRKRYIKEKFSKPLYPKEEEFLESINKSLTQLEEELINLNEEYNTNEKCPHCKKGTVALGSVFTNIVEPDSEPYKPNVVEKLIGCEDEVTLSEPINISVRFCDNCYDVFGADVQNDTPKKLPPILGDKENEI